MSDWECPHCSAEYYYGSHLDTVLDLGPCSKTNFECERCGTCFEMWVDFDPVFTIDKASIHLPGQKELDI
jgi:hypothetical protein